MPWREDMQAERLQLEDRNMWRVRNTLSSPQQVYATDSEGDFINFCSNDYLGLANSTELREALARAAARWGCGSGASHLVCGHMEPHHELELAAAEFVGAEKALLFSTGYMANLAVPTTFMGRNDLVYQDRLNHASLYDAGQLSRATVKRFRHKDMDHLESLLERGKKGKQMILSDSVFSMDGDLAPVPELVRISKENDALLLLDDAHGLGVIGDEGRGTLSNASLNPSGNTLMVGTLGKAAGCCGAFVAGDDDLIESLVQRARTYIYTTAIPPAIAECARIALSLIQRDSWRREQLTARIGQFKEGALQLGLNLSESVTPIQPLILGSPEAATSAAAMLRQEGMLVTAIRPPTVPVDTSRLRITLSTGHTETDVSKLLDALDNDAIKQMSGSAQ